ncbi:hypothetical protein SAMN04487764_1535 [Gillisia sp. Hel1_33_143]|uniref:hypothetical protein n=1 Tax=Gillisia sp. Hel1_33_143 TaxID=1336796 RepID=UPI00087B779C|nr:hypothetical protein [Gillisia sp. Hel1_33_143]SDS13693.1 hypothetical protein SAMN04487764_1535 [Gillisia sp. Hel1_33_143]
MGPTNKIALAINETLQQREYDNIAGKELPRAQRRKYERDLRKQTKKAVGLLTRITKEERNGNQEELEKLKEEYRIWKADLKK